MSINDILNVDPVYIVNFFIDKSVLEIVWALFIMAGWVPFVWMLIHLVLEFWVEYKEDKFKHHWKWVLLAIDIPALNVQTPKAVEQMFAHIAGAYDSPNIAGKFREGYKQRWFSFEIISIEGYIQFLARTEEEFRDLLEGAIYAQYPEAEIIEVEDYVGGIPDKYPNETHEMWASDFTLAQDSAFPIRTYSEFEHNISKDTVLKDPMGTFLESFSRLGPGEQMWFQTIVEPTGSSWKEKAIEKIKEFMGEETKHGGGNDIVHKMLDFPLKLLGVFGDTLLGREMTWGLGGEEAEAHEGPPNKLGSMSPGQKTLVEAMENKIAKIGFKTKMRGVYVARKEVFKPSRGVNALIGAINQFNIPTSNSLVPSFGVGASYFFKKQRSSHRKALMMEAYKKRKIKVGSNPFYLNIEELATVWHFPMSHVKTPLLQKATAKRSEPPAGLPVEEVLAPQPSSESIAEKKAKEANKKTYHTDAGDISYTSDQPFG